MSTSKAAAATPPRMYVWLLATVALMVLAHSAMKADAGGLYAVTLYKAHLMSLGGWGGYWLDRALFPYDRPHTYLIDDAQTGEPVAPLDAFEQRGELLSPGDYAASMLRRAIVVAAALVCVGLGA